MPHPHVTIEQGELMGTLNTDYKGGKFYSFKGIPYGRLPFDDFRFKTALPAGPWQGILDATVEKDVCFQWDMKSQQFKGSEDCLYLNVYTKALLNGHNDTPKPVMVFIHGGAFTHGSGNSDHYGPEFLMTEDIVLVTFNYRLGILGFLSFEDPTLDTASNAGVKDMLLVLKWVQQNIMEFSGDAANVTIFGESAGAAGVHYLILSPLAKGLFHKAILQSGSALNFWGQGRQISEETSKKLGASNSHELLEMLRGMPLEKLHEVQNKLEGTLEPYDQRVLGPVVENTSLGPVLITKNPLEIIKSGEYNQVPILIGYNEFEGIYLQLFTETSSTFKKIESNISFAFEFQQNSKEIQFLVDEIKKFYFIGKDISEASALDICRLGSDTTFVVDILATVKQHLKTLKYPIYLYKFSLDTELNYLKKAHGLKDSGTSHGDDLGYLFKTYVTPEKIQKNSIEDISIQRMVKLWTNFAHYGNPTIDNSLGVVWSPTSAETLNYLNIGEQLEVKQNPDNDVISLWRSFYKKTLHLQDYL